MRRRGVNGGVVAAFVLGMASGSSSVEAGGYNISDQPIFITNSESRCINRSADKIDLILKSIRIEKNGGFWKKDSHLGVTIGATPEADGDSSNIDRFEFPVMTEIDIRQSKKGFIQKGALQLTVTRGFKLSDAQAKGGKKVNYSGFNFGIRLIRTRGQGDGVRIVRNIIDQADNIPLPPNPYTAGFKQAASVLGGMFKGVADSEGGEDKITTTSNVVIDFDKDGEECSKADHAHTGYMMFLFEPNGSVQEDLKGGILSIDGDDLDRFCFTIGGRTLRPKFYDSKDGKCEEADIQNAKNINNPYFLFRLKAEAKDSTLNLNSEIEELAAAQETIKSISSLKALAPRLLAQDPESSGVDGAIKASENVLGQHVVETQRRLLNDGGDAGRTLRECMAFGFDVVQCLYGDF